MNGITIIIPVKYPEPYLPSLIGEIINILINEEIPHEIFIQTEHGITNATIRGIEKSQYNTIVVMDADGSHDPAYIPQMYACIHDYDLIVGSKVLGEDETSLLRKSISRVYRWFAKVLLNINIEDPMSGFVMGKRRTFLKLKQSTDYKFLLQLLVQNPPPKVKEIPIIFAKRQKGKSKSSWRTGFKTLHSIIKYWWISKV